VFVRYSRYLAGRKGGFSHLFPFIVKLPLRPLVIGTVFTLSGVVEGSDLFIAFNSFSRVKSGSVESRTKATQQ
jgi:hypothetical protein